MNNYNGQQNPQYQQQVYQQPVYPQPIYQQPTPRRGLGAGGVVAIVLGSVALLTVCVIVFVSLFNMSGYNTFDLNDASDSEDTWDTPTSSLGKFYYASNVIPDAAIIEQAEIIVPNMVLPGDAGIILDYKATPEMIYADVNLQAGVLWSCYFLSDSVNDIEIEKIQGKYVAPAEMELRGKRMFGVDILQFDVPSDWYAPYYNSEYDLYVQPQAGMLEGYFVESIEVISNDSFDNTVQVRVHVYERVHNEQTYEIEEVDRGVKDVYFSIENDGGAYYLRFKQIS